MFLRLKWQINNISTILIGETVFRTLLIISVAFGNNKEENKEEDEMREEEEEDSKEEEEEMRENMKEEQRKWK